MILYPHNTFEIIKLLKTAGAVKKYSSAPKRFKKFEKESDCPAIYKSEAGYLYLILSDKEFEIYEANKNSN